MEFIPLHQFCFLNGNFEYSPFSSKTADKADREVFAAIADEYTESIEGHHQALVINVLGGCLVLLAILIPFILKCDAFRKGIPMEGKTGNEDSEEED